VLAMGGAFSAIDELKARLVRSQATRVARIESGEQKVIGVNTFTTTEQSPLNGGVESIMTVDPKVGDELVADVQAWRASRDEAAVAAARAELERVARSTDPADNIMLPTIALAQAGGTTGEWANTLRGVFGEYRAPTGVRPGAAPRGEAFAALVQRSQAITARRGNPPKILVAKPGLDGHSNGAEQIAVAARDAGCEVIYQGIRLSVDEIAAAARDEDVDVVGVSILSGSHLTIIPRLLEKLRADGVTAAVVVGGIIPPEDAVTLTGLGVAAVYSPKDFSLAQIMDDLLDIIDAR